MSLAYFELSDTEKIVRECLKGSPIYLNLSMGNHGVTELLFIRLSENRLAVGRRNLGAIVVENIDDLIHVYKTPDGSNTLNTTYGDSIFFLPILISIFMRLRGPFQNDFSYQIKAPLPNQPTFSLSRDDESKWRNSQMELEHFIKISKDQPILEFRISHLMEKNSNAKTYSIVIARNWKSGIVYSTNFIGDDNEDEINKEKFVLWRECDGFAIAITDVGCWTWGEQANNDYMYEKLSLYRTGLAESSSEIKDLMTIFRKLCPILGENKRS